VKSVVASADPASRTFTARIAIANTGHALKPNMFARATIVTGKVTNAMLVPKEAVVNREGKTFVVRVVNDEAEVVPVQTGIATGNDIVVRSPALSRSDKIVTEGQNSLTTGQKVKAA
jgi:multidrug efflux pump subunit AcrA (membrane-fusion protein)